MYQNSTSAIDTSFAAELPQTDIEDLHLSSTSTNDKIIGYTNTGITIQLLQTTSTNLTTSSNIPSKKSYGTKEWSARSVNIDKGCIHKCKYCYAYFMAERFGRLDGEDPTDSWGNPVPNQRIINKGWKKQNGRIMFPTTHDITPKNMDYCFKVGTKLLEAGNSWLWVTKPHIECVQESIKLFKKYYDANIIDDHGVTHKQLEIRMTICSTNEKLLHDWEPGAPTFEERFKCLKLAYQNGCTTSISMEPMLDLCSVPETVSKLQDYVSGHLWIGVMNKKYVDRTKNTYPEMKNYCDFVIEDQTPDRVIKLYELLKDNPKIRWKDSIRKILSRNGTTLPIYNEYD